MKGQTHQKVLKHSLQSTLRNNMTDAERKVWSVLREQQVEDCKFRRQHPDGNDILDFVCLEHGLVIEVDAGQHLDSERDATRDASLKKSGFNALRFWNHDVLSDTVSVADAVYRVVSHLQKTHPHPNPLHDGKGKKAL